MGAAIWNRCLTQLERELSDQQLNTWIRPLQPELQAGILKLYAPNRFVLDWVREHFFPRIDAIVQDLGDDAPERVVLEVGSQARPATPAASPEPAATA